jgi:hypothetical protein
MILLVLVRKAVAIDEIIYDPLKEDIYYQNYSSAFVSPTSDKTWNELQIRAPL